MLRRVADARAPAVGYVVSRFPKLTETFVLYEMLELERQGTRVELYPLLRERAPTMHPEAAAWVARARFRPYLGWRLLRANLRWLATSPQRYLGALRDLLRGTWGSRRYFLGALGLFPKAAAFAEQMMADGVGHVHAHFASHPAAAAFVIQRLAGIPYSFTAHGSDLHRDRRMLAEKVAEAAFVVAISEYNRAVIAESCGPEASAKIVVLHCGVDPEHFAPAPPEPEAGGARELRLLCTGTLHEVKGQVFLLEACALLRERGVALRCEFIGGGPDRSALEARARELDLGSCVHFLGTMARGEVAARLARADVVVAPSVPTHDGRREGIPVALMEALAVGKPVVASDLSGIPELVEHGRTGLLVPPRDPRALAEALGRLAASPELRARLGEQGRRRVLREFDLETNVKELAMRFAAVRCR